MNLLRKTIASKGSAVGTFLNVSTPSMVECLGYAGLDFVIIDMEHGPYDTQQAADLVAAAVRFDMAPLIRVADLTHKDIQHAADSGAHGIIIPCLRQVSEFRKAVELAKFAPVGSRGYFKARGSGYGNEPWASGSLEDYMRRSNEKLLLLPQCETAEALEHIEEITAIDGVDGIYIGPFDLSISLGVPGRFDHPVVKEAIERIFRSCKKNGKLCMMFSASPEKCREYIDKGMEAVTSNIDMNVFTEAYRGIVSSIRG